MKLTKKYRIVYNNNGEILNDPETEYNEGSVTLVPSGLNGYEAQMKSTIENFIKENNLVIKNNEVENGGGHF